jgi:Histidine kinase-, DNA gyrase B-, and HSP90-like ATPase
LVIDPLKPLWEGNPMIDLSVIEQSQAVVTVSPSDNIFDELGRNTYDYKDLLSELIDNSIAARRKGESLSVAIDIYADVNGKPMKFVIKDNAKGIPIDKLGTAISPAGIQSKNSLNEHGMGMKQAVAALGKLNYLATKTEGERQARAIREFRYGNIPTFLVDFESECGTEIAISNLNPIVTVRAANYTSSIVPYLGARYRRYLKSHSKQLDLTIRLKSFEHPDQVLNDWRVKEEKPIYLHPSTRNNEPVISAFRVEVEGWTAELTFGYAPTRKQDYEEMGLVEPNKFHPYRVSLSTQGLDIIFHDRVILFHQLSELGIVSARHNDYNNIRGEIDLKHGFSTAITKNSIGARTASDHIKTKHGKEIVLATRDQFPINQPPTDAERADYY